MFLGIISEYSKQIVFFTSKVKGITTGI